MVTGWLVPYAGQKIPVESGWYLPVQKIPLAENRFLQAGKRTENTKEKSRQCFTVCGNPPPNKRSPWRKKKKAPKLLLKSSFAICMSFGWPHSKDMQPFFKFKATLQTN